MNSSFTSPEPVSHAPTRERPGSEGRRQVVWAPPDLFRILTVLGSGLRWLIAAPVAGILLTAVYILATNPTYEVGAQVMVRYGSEMTAPATVTAQTNQVAPTGYTRPEDISAEVQIMKDPRLIHDVVVALGEDFFFGETPPVGLFQTLKYYAKSTLRGLKDGVRAGLVSIGILPELGKLDMIEVTLPLFLEVNHVARSDVIELMLRYPDPVAGEAVLTEFLNAYKARRVAVYQNAQIPAYFETEFADTETELAAAEDELNRMRENLKAWSIDDQRSMNVEQRENLVQGIRDATAGMQVAQARLAGIDAQLATLPEWVPASDTIRSNPVLDELALRRVDLLLAVQAAERQSGVRSPQVESLNRQIAELEALIAVEPKVVMGESTQDANPIRETLKSSRAEAELVISSTQKEIEILTRSLAEVEETLRGMDVAALALTRQARLVERLYSSRARNQAALEQARIAAEISEARISNLIVVAEPKAGVAPSKPRVFRLMLLVAVLSVIVAAAVLLLTDALRPRVRNNADLRRAVGPGTIVRAVADRGRA